MLQHFPRATLPRGFIPRKNFPLITPLFVYGFPFSNQELETFARKNKLLVQRGHLSLSDTDSEDEDSKAVEMRMDLIRTANAVFKYIQEELNITSFQLTLGGARHQTTDADRSYCMIITSNWTWTRLRGKETVFADDVQKLQRLWSANESPMWYNTSVGQSSWLPRDQ